MDKNPLVSILIPNFNKGPYLAECIWSALSQTYRPCEIVVYENGSTDQSLFQLQAFSNMPNVKILTSPSPVGVAAAVNHCLSNATGEYIILLGSDDRITPDHVMLLMTKTKEHPDADIIYGDLEEIDKDGKVTRYISAIDGMKTIYDHCSIGHAMSIVKKAVYNEIGGYDEILEMSVDWEFILRALKIGKQFQYAGKTGYQWRRLKDGDSLSIRYGGNSETRKWCHFYIRTKYQLEGPCGCGCGVQKRSESISSSYKIVALIPTYQRKEITIETIKRLREQTTQIDHIVVIGSCSEDEKASKEADHYIEVANFPLGAKLQAGIEYSQSLNPDAILLCGSDDWLSNNWVEALIPYLSSYDLIGVDRLYVLTYKSEELQLGQCSYERSETRTEEPMGPGRLISRRVLDKLNWKLFPATINKGLDKTSFQRILKVQGKIFLETTGQVKLLAVKGDWPTINNWDAYIRKDRVNEVIDDPRQWLRDNFPLGLKMFGIPVAPSKIVAIPTLDKPLNIIMLSGWDFGASGWQIVQAIKKHTNHNIVHIKRFVHGNQYPAELILDGNNRRKVRLLLEKADIVHFKGDELPFRSWERFRIPNKAKIIVTVAGTGFRRSPDGWLNPIAKQWFPIKDYVKHSDFRTAITPDLNYPEFQGIYTQELIDSESIEYCWTNREIPIIGYFPAYKNRKGFDTHIQPALEQLEKIGYRFERLPTVGVSYKESVEMKKRMTVFIDQITWAGGYGNSALEAMQFGVPVITYLSERSLRQSNSEEFRGSPILNPGFTVEGLVKLLKKILDKELDLRSISLKTKQYCDTFHGYSRGAKMWDNIYKQIV